MDFVPCSRAFPAIPHSLPKHDMTLEASLFTISKLQTAINGKSISGDMHGPAGVFGRNPHLEPCRHGGSHGLV